ncbi:preprotein translocase subunit SecA [Mycobacterium colombiense]|uniref:preprotein translocase subunit SecA n=1 Tax=Mycobacterium colombiense TaxID=339268 RepID=UPI0012DB7486|nr:preprotein translocase subunit SecA [Mycobacterium colombiense]
MTSRTKRRELRRKRRQKGGATAGRVDRHSMVIMKTLAEAAQLLEQAPDGDAVLPWLEQKLEQTVESLAFDLGRYGTFAVCEVARLNFLPWNFMQGTNFMDTEAGPARIELLTLLAASSASPRDADAPIWHQTGAWKAQVDSIIQLSSLAHLHQTASDGTLDPMAKIQYSTRAGEVLMRDSSYPEMVKATLADLFDEQAVKHALISLLGFDLTSAVSVLECCDEIQTDKMNSRFNIMGTQLADAISLQDPSQEQLQEVRDQLDRVWDPDDDDISIRPAEVADRLGIEEALVKNVLTEFTLGNELGSPYSVVEDFTAGDNALRTNPLVSDGHERFMLVHPSLVLPAIRENFEQKLKNSPFWNQYQTHRGKYLETEASACLSAMLPGAQIHSGFEYFIPTDETERQDGPAHYTKLVEGDLLFILDDIAVITEAKAVALAPKARAGDTRRLRSDLTRIITKASEQADRLKTLIEHDGGFRLKDGTKVDTSHIREIHTIAVSLEDLSGVSTATADLLRAGLLDENSIPWTVSLNDLRLVTQLVDQSAVAMFMLYLRRRRHPEATVMYAAVDELDFFLYFFENGLYVQPDPELMAQSLEFISQVSTGDRRRRDKQSRQFITSRTDPLDAWYRYENGLSDTLAPKPSLKGSPALPLVEELQKRKDYAWCSIGATLLSGSTQAQEKFMATPALLLKHAKADGKPHSVTRPYGSSRADAWVLVWAVEDTSTGIDSATNHLRDYIRAKKYQLRVPRAAAFIFDSQSAVLHSVIYEGSPLIADAHLQSLVQKLMPADHWQKSVPGPPKQRRNKRKE